MLEKGLQQHEGLQIVPISEEKDFEKLKKDVGKRLPKPDGRTIHFVETKEWLMEKTEGHPDLDSTNETIKTWPQDFKWVMVLGPALEQGVTWEDFRSLAPKVVAASAVAGVIIGGVGGYLGF